MRTFCSISDASVVVSLGCTLPPHEAASDFQWRSRMPGLSSAVISGRLPLKSSSFSLMCSTTLSGPLRPVSPLASLYSWRPQLPTSASTCSGESCTNGPSSHVGYARWKAVAMFHSELYGSRALLRSPSCG